MNESHEVLLYYIFNFRLTLKNKGMISSSKRSELGVKATKESVLNLLLSQLGQEGLFSTLKWLDFKAVVNRTFPK